MTVTTSAPNDFATGQKVTITGVTGGTGTFNGDFVINVTNSTTFTYSASGSGNWPSLSVASYRSVNCLRASSARPARHRQRPRS